VDFYVVALTDRRLRRRRIRGREYESLKVGPLYAIGERRSERPPVLDDELRRQHDVVAMFAAKAQAILPARFGTLLSDRALSSLVEEHEEALRQGLEDVRGRTQMNLRFIGGARKPVRGESSRSGREYLERKRILAIPTLPPDAQALLARLEPLVVRERRTAGAGSLIATVYHLVNRDNVMPYLDRAAAAGAGVIVSGPFPPFAFVPVIL
jgi:hypothetical protein